jgi:valyl-tRNA synthetase
MSLSQDPDVLDTWFSSGLFPFSTMGWPNEEALDFQAFFPGSLLETGHDILFFWVARMVMMSQTLTDRLPFKDVYLHAMVRDKYGKKMSKSSGNVIDPLLVIQGTTLDNMLDTLRSGLLPAKELKRATTATKKEYPSGIPRCGADALRFGLLAYTSQGRDVNLDINRVIGYRKFCNKLWNLHKLGLYFGLNDIEPPASYDDLLANYDLSENDRWILSRLSGVATSINASFASYSFAEVCSTCYEFLLKEFASVYAEIAKPALRGEAEGPKRAAIATFYVVLEASYRMLHPIMPFVTEELWQRLPGRRVSQETKGEKEEICTIALAVYPDPSKDESFARLKNKEAEDKMHVVISTIEAIRGLSGKYLTGNASSAKPNVVLTCSDAATSSLLDGMASEICSLVKLASVKCVEVGAELEKGMASSFATDSVTAHMMLAGTVDFRAELPGLQKKLQKEVTGKINLERKRTPEYLEKAKVEIQFRENELLEEYATKISLLEEQIAMFESLAGE